MIQWVPELVTLAGVAVPREPPVPHLRRHAGHLGETGHHELVARKANDVVGQTVASIGDVEQAVRVGEGPDRIAADASIDGLLDPVGDGLHRVAERFEVVGLFDPDGRIGAWLGHDVGPLALTCAWRWGRKLARWVISV